jgi:hypothetical protein
MANDTHPKTSEQLHYESIRSFLIWALGIVGTLIVTVAAFAIFISYNDRNAMKEEYTKAISDLRFQISDLRNDAKEKAQSIKEDAKDAVKSTQEYSEKEISRIIISTNQIAQQETQKQIAAIFATDKIQNIIENQAVKEIKSKVSQIVEEQTKNDYSIQYAATRMRQGIRDGEKTLKQYYLKAENTEDSIKARKLYDEICKPYQDIAINYIKTHPVVNFYNNGRMPDDKYVRQGLENIMKEINDPNTDLSRLAFIIIALRESAKRQFKCFETREINDWFNGLKK